MSHFLLRLLDITTCLIKMEVFLVFYPRTQLVNFVIFFPCYLFCGKHQAGELGVVFVKSWVRLDMGINPLVYQMRSRHSNHYTTVPPAIDYLQKGLA